MPQRLQDMKECQVHMEQRQRRMARDLAEVQRDYATMREVGPSCRQTFHLS